MGRFDNPSAGKFDPPPGQDRFEAPRAKRTRRWSALAITILIFFLRYQLDHSHLSGSVAMLGVLAMLGLAMADYWFGRRSHDERTGGEPYGPHQNVTR